MIRHRLEYIGVRTLITAVRFMPPALVDACGSALGMTFYLLDRAHRRVAQRNVAAAFPTRTVAEHTVIVRGAFRHFGRLLFELLKFSTLSTEADAGARRVRRRGARPLGLRAGQGRALRHRALRLLGTAGDRARLQLPPMSVMARALDNPVLQRAARTDADAHRQQRHLPPGNACAA